MSSNPSILCQENSTILAQLKRIAGLLLGIAIYGTAGADDVNAIVKKPATSNPKDEIVTLPTVEVKTEKKSAGYKADSTTVGTKTDTPLIETPQSISIITQEQLQDQRADSLATALRYTPGVQGETFGFNPRATSLKIRGFDSITTGLFRDGLQLRTPTPSGEAFSPEPYCADPLPFSTGRVALAGWLTLSLSGRPGRRCEKYNF